MDILNEILSAPNYASLFPDLSVWKIRYTDLVKQVHPDVCKDPGASDAIAKLNHFKDILDHGQTHSDDAGKITYRYDGCEIQGDRDCLERSYKFYSMLMKRSSESDKHFQRYLPASAELNGNILKFGFSKIAIPLSSVKNIGIIPSSTVKNFIDDL